MVALRRIDEAVQLGYGEDHLYGSFYAFGADSLNSLADSDALRESLEDSGRIYDLQKTVAGIALFAVLDLEPFLVSAEYVGASEQFDVADLEFDGDGAKPAAWHFELGYGFQIGDFPAWAGAAYQKSVGSVGLGLPESRVLAAL